MKVFTDYEGRAVRLTDERLSQILEHPEMVKMAQNDAFVLTAYLISKPAGGKQIWPKSG